MMTTRRIPELTRHWFPSQRTADQRGTLYGTSIFFGTLSDLARSVERDLVNEFRRRAERQEDDPETPTSR